MTDLIKYDSPPEKRTSWTIDGVHVDFKEPVTLEEAMDTINLIRGMYGK